MNGCRCATPFVVGFYSGWGWGWGWHTSQAYTQNTLTLFRWPGLKLKGASFKFSMVKSSNASGVSHPSESRVDAYRLTSGCAAGRPRAPERCEVNAEIVANRALSSSRAAAPDSFPSSSCCSRRSGLLDPHPILRAMKVAQACSVREVFKPGRVSDLCEKFRESYGYQHYFNSFVLW